MDSLTGWDYVTKSITELVKHEDYDIRALQAVTRFLNLTSEYLVKVNPTTDIGDDH